MAQASSYDSRTTSTLTACNGLALSMWTHASEHVDCLISHYEQVTHHMTDEANIAQCPKIHTSQFSLEWMLSVLCMHSMWCQCILCTTSCACRLCVYCVCNVPVSGTASQYMLLCMHVIAAREALVLVTAPNGPIIVHTLLPYKRMYTPLSPSVANHAV